MQAAQDVKQRARDNPMSEWPRPRSGRADDLVEGELAVPSISPSFQLKPGESVFTLGSCFTREIEEELARLDFDVPCHRFHVPEHERDGPRPNSVLNQYVPPVMLQELRRALPGATSEPGRCLVETADGQVIDMQLFASQPVSRERGARRRAEVEALFRRAFTCQVAVITLGQTEAWWDDHVALFCNQMPTGQVLQAHPDRFYFRRLGLGDIVEHVSATCELLTQRGTVDRVILTVSPVPISRAWDHADALTAYVYSKSLLRVAAETVAGRLEYVDYFPSYDIVALSDRSKVFSPDRMHLRAGVAKEIVSRMVDAYL
jgi:GSCFA family protein